MGCGIKDENNDVCGDTFTCERCRSAGEIGRMNAEIECLEQILYAARDLIDLELSEEIPASFTTEWSALKDALEAASGPKSHRKYGFKTETILKAAISKAEETDGPGTV